MYPLLREEVIVLNNTTCSHGYHLSHKISYNLHISNAQIICINVRHGGLKKSFPLLGKFVCLFETDVNILFSQMT